MKAKFKITYGTWGCQVIEDKISKWSSGGITKDIEIEFEPKPKYHNDVVALQELHKSGKAVLYSFANTAVSSMSIKLIEIVD